ncbi:MAG: GspE/PulE family protein, partial [Thermodesulfobacteriota bacterium]
MKQKKRLGEILVEAGLLSEEQLKNALTEHKKENLKLGQYLVRQSLINERQIMDQVAKQLQIEKYDPHKYPVDPAVASIIPSEMAKQYQVAPLKKKGHLLILAMTDPMDINALDAVEIQAKCEAAPVICTEQSLNQLIASLYGQYTDLKYYQEEKEPKPGQEGELTTGPLQEEAKQAAERASVIHLVNSILTQAVRDRASDVHITPEKDYIYLQFRVDGKLHDVPAPPKSMFLSIASRLKIMANLEVAISRLAIIL